MMHTVEMTSLKPMLFTDDGKLTHAAFAITLKLSLSKTPDLHFTTFTKNLPAIISVGVEQLLKNCPEPWPIQRHLVELGIPPTYASTGEDLKAFLDLEHAPFQTVTLEKAQFVFKNEQKEAGSPSSITMHYDEAPFTENPQGNVRSREVLLLTAGTEVLFQKNAVFNAVIHLDKKDLAFRVAIPTAISDIYTSPLVSGHVFIKVIMIDRRDPSKRPYDVEG